MESSHNSKSSADELWEELRRDISHEEVAELIHKQKVLRNHIAIKLHALICNNPDCSMLRGGSAEPGMQEWMVKAEKVAEASRVNLRELNAAVDAALRIYDSVAVLHNAKLVRQLLSIAWNWKSFDMAIFKI